MERRKKEWEDVMKLKKKNKIEKNGRWNRRKRKRKKRRIRRNKFGR